MKPGRPSIHRPPGPPPNAHQKGGGRTYTVKSGDTLSEIAQREGVSLQSILDGNPVIKNPDFILPGMSLRLPAGQAPSGPDAQPNKPPAMPPSSDKLDKQPRGGMGRLGGLLGGAGRTLPKVQELPAFQKLSPAHQQQLQDLGMTSPQKGALVNKLLTSPAFQGMPDAQKAKAIDVFGGLDISGRFAFLKAGERQLNGKSIFQDKAADGSTLIDNLHKMSSGDVHPGFAKSGVSTSNLMASALREAGNPGVIRQDSKGTCTVTSMQYLLAKKSPAEYGKAMAGLASKEGTYKTPNGTVIPRDDGLFAPDSATDRSHTSRLFQGSMMEYSNGAQQTYDNATDKHSDGTGGLSTEDEGRGMAALFGKAETQSVWDEKKNTSWFADGSDAARWMTSFKKGDTFESLQQATDTTLLGFKWGDGAHAVAFERIEGNRLYFRNPWGRQHVGNGTLLKDPPRRMENATTGLESMSLDDAKKYLTDTVISP